MLILIGAVPERLVHGDQSRPLLPSSLAPPGPAVGLSTATLIQGSWLSAFFSFCMDRRFVISDLATTQIKMDGKKLHLKSGLIPQNLQNIRRYLSAMALMI